MNGFRLMTSLPIWILISAFLTEAWAVDADQSFRDGNARYQEGRYSEAIQQYLQILESGQASGALYFNLGNCHYKLGEIGPALLNYERALKWLPHDSDILGNLQIARQGTVDRIEAPPQFWVYQRLEKLLFYFHPKTLLGTVVFCYFALGAALTFRILKPQFGRRTLLDGILWSLVGMALLAALPLMGQHWLEQSSQSAIIMVPEASVVSAPAGEGIELFRVHEGTKAWISQSAGEWFEIVLEDGKSGWLEQHQAAII